MKHTHATFVPMDPAKDPIVVQNKTLMVRTLQLGARFDAEVARTEQLVALAAISRPPWWETPQPAPKRRKGASRLALI